MSKIKAMTVADIFSERGTKGRVIGKFNHPVHGKSNTEFHQDYGTVENQVQRNADSQRSFMGVHNRPKEFQPFFRFGGSMNGATDKSDTNGVVGGQGIGQPTSLAYAMEKQGIKLAK